MSSGPSSRSRRLNLPPCPTAEIRRSRLPSIPRAPGATPTGPGWVTLELITPTRIDLVDRAQPPSPSISDPPKGPPVTGRGAVRGGAGSVVVEPRRRGNRPSSADTAPRA